MIWRAALGVHVVATVLAGCRSARGDASGGSHASCRSATAPARPTLPGIDTEYSKAVPWALLRSTLNALANPSLIPIINPSDPSFKSRVSRLAVTFYRPKKLDGATAQRVAPASHSEQQRRTHDQVDRNRPRDAMRLNFRPNVMQLTGGVAMWT